MKKNVLLAYFLLPFKKAYYFNKFIINHKFNNKFFFRYVFKNSENNLSSAFLLDNFNNSYNSIIPSKNFFLKKKKLNYLGYSAQFTITYYKKVIQNIKYFFSITNNCFNVSVKNALTVFSLLFALLVEKRKSFLVLLTPIKGGYRAYSTGFIGFLPGGQFNFLLKDFLKSENFYNKVNRLFLYNLIFNLHKKSYYNKYFLYWLPTKVAKFEIKGQASFYDKSYLESLSFFLKKKRKNYRAVNLKSSLIFLSVTNNKY